MNPKGCIPCILQRLKAKEKEWIEEKVALNERCREIQKQNYYLSLDHRSFYFRQQDKKDITTKVLVDTIKVYFLFFFVIIRKLLRKVILRKKILQIIVLMKENLMFHSLLQIVLFINKSYVYY